MASGHYSSCWLGLLHLVHMAMPFNMGIVQARAGKKSKLYAPWWIDVTSHHSTSASAMTACLRKLSLQDCWNMLEKVKILVILILYIFVIISRSVLWNFFTKEPDNPDYALCNLCAVKICRNGGSTTAMGNHLRIKHKSVILSSGQSSTKPKVPPTLPQSLMKSSRSRPTQYMRPLDKSETERLRRALAWMCAVDVRPISIVQGLGFRNYSRLMNANFVVPSRKTVTSYIAKIYQEGLNMGHKGKGQGSIQRALGKARRLITFFNHSIPGRHILVCD